METAAKYQSSQDKAGQTFYGRKKQRGLIAFGKKARHSINRFLAKTSLIPNDPFIDPRWIPGIDRLASDWTSIRAELDGLMATRSNIPPLGSISPDHRRIAPNDAWRSFFFVGHGFRVVDNCQRCPKTAALIDQVPGVVVAFFSIFEPHTHVPPHRGVTKAMLNVHLPLIVPTGPGKCELWANEQVRNWHEGELLVLDETWQHEAFNLTDEVRVVLFLQVKRPMRWHGRLVGNLFLWAMRQTSYVKDARNAIAAKRMKSGSQTQKA